MSELLAAELAAIRDCDRAATPGPWKQFPDTHAGRVWVQIGTQRHEADCEPLFRARTLGRSPTEADYRQREADAAFIVAARTAIPRLLAAIGDVLKLADGWELNSAKVPVLSREAAGVLIRSAISRHLLGDGEPGE